MSLRDETKRDSFETIKESLLMPLVHRSRMSLWRLIALTLVTAGATTSVLGVQQSKFSQQAEQELRKAQEEQANKSRVAAAANPRRAANRAPRPSTASRARAAAHSAARKAALTRRSTRGMNLQAAAQVEFTFVGNMPGINIFLNKRPIGVTGSDGKLTARLRAGLHWATLARLGYRTQSRQVQVQPEQNTFTFKLVPLARGVEAAGTAAANKATAGTTTAANQPDSSKLSANANKPPAAEPSSAPPSTADDDAAKINLFLSDEVMKRFFDPRQNSSVTASDWQQVLTQTRAVLAADGNNLEARKRQLFAQGQLSFLQRNYADALIAYRNIIELMPNSPLGHYGAGNVYLASSQYAEALRSYNRVVRIDPKFAMAYRGIGDALSSQGHSQQALENYERARGLNYFTPRMAMTVGRIFADRERWAEALDYLVKIPAEQQNADVLILMGDAYIKLKKMESARDVYHRATLLNSSSPIAHYKLGETLFRQQKYQQAIEPLERSLVLDVAASGAINRDRARRMVEEANRKIR